jgi:hypothetical protein
MRDKILEEAGYENRGNYWAKVEKGICHRVMLFKEIEYLRLTCTDLLANDGEFLYDTGNLKINDAELIFLINILNR